MTSSVLFDVIIFLKTLEFILITSNMKFDRSQFIRSRCIDVKFQQKIDFFKREVNTQTHKKTKNGIKRSCWLKKYILFSNLSKIEKFRKNMHIFQISVRHFEYLMSMELRLSPKTIKQRLIPKLRYSEILIKIVLIFKPDFALRVRLLIFPGMTSSKNDDVRILRSAQLK